MVRKYNSRRREENAAQTRLAIVEAAIKLHGQGITTLSAVADEADVSLPTVNKYFPTREDLFVACTSHFAASLEVEAPDMLRAIDDPGERLRRVVYEVYHLNERSFGQSWTGYKLEDESPVLAQAMAETEGLIATLADTLTYEHAVGDEDTARRFVRAALSPLTYRALRLKNGLSFEQSVDNMALALAGVLNIEA
ncbi:MAG: TetR/AcrR family transcriptional regulator [Anaerolineae bacterium]|nr:TetR/AcrR family transcriptional regulator [Anaerolineae bacterium]